MALVVDRLPFSSRRSTILLGGEEIAVKADQIVLWMSLTEEGASPPVPRSPRFPAVLDTGLSHNFAIREEQLADWAGLYPPLLHMLGHGRLNGRSINVLAADAWIHRNRPGQRDALPDYLPFPLDFTGGIAVYPRGTPDTPRLPALGMRALRLNGLRLLVEGDRCLVSLRTRRRFGVFG